MACRGVFFALSPEDEAKLLSADDSDEVVEIITEEIEERWDKVWLEEMDKAWDAIHRCLGDGTLGTSQPGLPAKAVLGGRQLSSRDDYIVSYLTADEVKNVSAAIAPIEKPEFRRRYFGLKKKFLWFDRTDYEGPIGDEDFEYSWSYFEDMRRLFFESGVGESTDCVHRRPMTIEPNKAPEPTPTSVTSPADAGAAPAVVVAHL